MYIDGHLYTMWARIIKYKNYLNKFFQKRDEFDKRYGFLLKYGIVSKKAYLEVKAYYYQNLLEK